MTMEEAASPPREDIGPSPFAPGQHPSLPPPSSIVGPVAWLRNNLFSSWLNIALTLGSAYLLYVAVPPLLDWAVFDANWHAATSRAECTNEGACWSMVIVRFEQFLYGFYPVEERWRVDLTFLIFVATFVPAMVERTPGRRYFVLFLFTAFPIIAYFLLYGGLGLPEVETYKWGGLMLTLVLGIVGIVVSLPLGIVLALGRRSTLPVIRMISTAFIELVRAVPLVTVLFMASVMLPLFLPEGVTTDKLVRALIGISLFSAAYMAEVIRGGLQAIPKGQYEAAQALGLNYWKMMGFVVLPQALRIVIPGIVNTTIGLFKDTTLVLIIGLYELLGMVQLATRDAHWRGTSIEGFVFTGVVFWIFCFGMSRYSQALEQRLPAGARR